MLSRVCFIFGVLCIVTALIAALILRDANDHMFYQLRVYRTEIERLDTELRQKQLQLERLTNPERILLHTQPKDPQ